MYLVVEGEYEVQLQTGPIRLGDGNFFGELALLTGEPRNATVVATRPCVTLALDIVDFHELLARQPELARVIREEARKRLAGNMGRASGQRVVAADGSDCQVPTKQPISRKEPVGFGPPDPTR